MEHEVPLVTKKNISLIAIDTSLEASAIRAMLENYNYRVVTQWIGSKKELVEVLAGRIPTDDLIILSCHGIKEGIAIPDERPLTADEIQEIAHLDGKTMISTGCLTGRKAYKDAFKNTKAANYIAPTGYPEATSALVYLSILFYELSKGKLLKDAHKTASSLDQETAIFSLTSA